MVDIDEMVRVLDGLDDLPTLPTIYTQVSELVRDPKVSVADVAKVIEMDQAITSKILRLVNSSFFGFSRQVTSIRQAVVLLGFTTVQNTVLSVSVFDSISPTKVNGFDLKEYWRHSIGCGIVCTSLDRILKTGHKEETFVAGLLHDIGKLILDRYFASEFGQAVEYANTNGVTFYESERLLIGCTHDEIGEYLAEKWKLPYSLVEAIALHHQPSNLRSEPKLVSLVHIADYFTHRLGFGFSTNYGLPEAEPFALDELGLDGESLANLEEKLEKVLEDNSELFSLVN